MVGYDGTHMSKMVSPKLTTWQQNTQELGRIAANRLIEMIEHPDELPPRHIVVEGKLQEGATVRQLA